MSAHRFRVGQTVVVPWSGPEGAIPLGPYVIVRLLPVEHGEPHYRVRSSSMATSGRFWKIRSGHWSSGRLWSRFPVHRMPGGADSARIGRCACQQRECQILVGGWPEFTPTPEDLNVVSVDRRP